MISSSDESNENVHQAAAFTSENSKSSPKPEAVLNSELNSLWFLPHGFQHVPPPSLHNRCPGQWALSATGNCTVPLPPDSFPEPSSSNGKATSKNVWVPPLVFPFPWLQNTPPPPSYVVAPNHPVACEDWNSFSKLKWRSRNNSHFSPRNNGYLKKPFLSHIFCPDERFFRYRSKYEKFKSPQFTDKRCCRRIHLPDNMRHKFMPKFKGFRPNYHHFQKTKPNIGINNAENFSKKKLASDSIHELVEQISTATLLNETDNKKNFLTDQDGIKREHEIETFKLGDSFASKNIFSDPPCPYWSVIDTTADKFKSGQDNHTVVVKTLDKCSSDPSKFVNIEHIDPTTRYEEHVESAKFSSVTCVIENFESSNNCGIQVHPQGQGQDEITKTRHGRVQSVKFLPDDSSTAMSNISGGNGGVRAGKSATVAFIDIRSAAKALRSVHSMAGQPLQITYHEPGSVPPRSIQPTEHSSPGDSVVATANDTSTNAGSSLPLGNPAGVSGPGISNGPNPNVSGPGLYRQPRFPIQHGQSEDSSSHFYEQPKGFSRGRGDGHGFHGTRGRREHRHPYHNNRHSFPGDRNYRMSWGGYPNEGRFAPPAHSEVDERTSGPPPSSHPPQNENSSKGTRRPDSPASSVSSRHLPSKRHKSRSVSESGSSDRGSSGGSRSRSGSRSSVSTSVSSGRSRSPPHHSSSGHYSSSRGGSPGGRFHQNSYSRQRYSRSRLVSRPADSSRVRHSSRSPPMAASPSSSASSSPSPHRKINAAPHSPSHSPSSAKSYSPSRSLNQSGHHHHHHRRTPNSAELQSAIKIRNLPIRSSDTSLKDGLYHEYKKHGKVSWVRVIGTGSERFAIVCFKSSEHATRAVALSQDKQFFGCKIQVSAYYNSRGDEPLGGPDEDNRGLGDDEPSSVSYPTRTVLITGLDSLVTESELKTAFDQYGDIVAIDIRKQGASTHAVCEFVDIASAIRAQWGRHMFKSREARISFYRASPSNSLLLDGTDGVNEKQITGHCSQYGAISRVIMDTDRILALVQFDEISSAQTAIRELRSWVIKGKHLHVDFASPDCIRMFLERVAVRGGVIRGDNSSPNIRLSTTPPLNNSIGGIALKGVRRSNRRFAECPIVADERKSPYSIYRHTNDVDFEGTKPITQLRMLDDAVSPESASCVQLRQNSIGNTGSASGIDESGVGSGLGYRRRVGFTSPVSPDLNMTVDNESSSEISVLGKEHSKIDLSCHETDSAVVTSSSDVILAENDIHSNHDSSLMNGDDKHNSYEFVVRIGSNSNVSCMSNVAVAVDGVSSTSPEPKTETVRKASPDPGIGLGMPESTPRIIVDPHIITTGLVDPRKKPSESKIRRSSADSGSNNGPSTIFGQHSMNGGSTSSFVPSIYSSTIIHTNANVNHSNHIGSEGGEESDDRPGTPLCDENPESFVSTENNTMTIKLPSRNASHSSKNEQPLSLPLPEFALQQRFTQYSNGSHPVGRHNSSSVLSSREHMMMVRISRSSSEATILKSPIKSPVYDGGASVMNSSASECDIFSPSSHSESKTISDRHSNTRIVLSSSSNASTNNNSWNDVDSPELSGSLRSGNIEDNSSNRLGAKCEDIGVLDESDSPRIESLDNEAQQDSVLTLNLNIPDEQGPGVGSSSDSESGSSPRRSPTGTSLEQRIKKFYERYDQWNGIRTTVRSSTVPLHQGAMATLDNLGKSSTVASNLSTGSESTESLSSSISRFVRTKHKVLDLDEMRHQPSDIVKSLLAKKSVFDEDTKRLENFGEKYEAKPASITAANWRLALNRSTSSTSASSTTSGVSTIPQTPPPQTPTTPIAPLNTFPGPSTPTTPGAPTPRTPGQSGAQLPPVSPSPSLHSKSQHYNSLSHPLGPPTAGKPVVKDLNVNNPNSGRHRSTTNVLNNVHGKPLPTKSTSPTGVSKSTNIVASFPPLPSSKPQTDVANKSSIPTSLAAPSSTGKNFITEGQNCGATTPVLTGQNSSRISTTSTKSSVVQNSTLTSNPIGNGVVQSGIHHGIPRMVERSMSLDSKRSLTQISPNVSSSAGCSPNSASNNVSPSVPTTPSERPSVRRISADSHPASVIKEAQLPRKSSDSISEVNSKISKETPTTLTKERLAKVVQAKDELSSKNVSVIKTEAPMVHHHNHSQETTVAVVASVQTPMLLPKDSKKDSREKKRRSSGSSATVQSNPHNSAAGNFKPEGSSSTSSAKPSSSGKERKDKDKDVKKTSDDTASTSNNNNPHHSSGIHHHSKSSNKGKEKVKEEKEHSVEATTPVPPSTNKESHGSHRKDKDKEITKMKRRLSSQDSEQHVEPKKIKIEKKESHGSSKETSVEISHNNHRSKHGSTSERRESRDSSSSAKEKSKEKVEKDRETTKSETSVSVSKDKEQHHKSKPSGSSSSSSSAKHHHHGDKDKSKSSADGHSSSYSHKSVSEVSKRKDKTSPGKESSSGKSKHSSSSNHGHSHHSGSNKKESSSKSRSTNSKDKDSKSKEKHGSTTVESDEENESSVSTPIEKEKDREKVRDRGDKHEKRESSFKRDRHKSGGDSSAPGGTDSIKGRNKLEQKKKRRYVIDESESSDSGKTDEDEDEKQKHHSIFDVIIDEYVSMYDKVKARSNRACKNNPTPQQQKEEQRKQEKLKEQFQQLKQSRAKREEKKRSTSIEERKSFVNSSSDDESHAGTHPNDSDTVDRDHAKLDRERERHRERLREVAGDQSSDDESHHNHKSSSRSSVSKGHQKSKSRSSKGKTKQKGRRSSKSSPVGGTSFPSTSSIFFSQSDEDSHASSPPITKKRKLKHQFQTSGVSHQSVDTKSSDESVSDYDSNVTKRSSSKLKYSTSNSSKINKKLRTADIYSDSDSSVRSSRGSKNAIITPSKLKSSREKVGKQKSMDDIKKLFDDSSDSSAGEEPAPLKKVSKEVKEKEESSKPKSKEKESKSSSGRKKHHSVTSNRSSSSKGSRRQRLSSGDTASCDAGSGHTSSSVKRESSANMKDIFGSMTPTSCSDVEEKPNLDERPKTPTPMVLPPSGIKPYEETPVSSKSKSKNRSKQRKSSSSAAQGHSGHGSHSSVEDVSMDSTLITPSGKSTSEKKKRRHHREKRPRGSDSQETSISSSTHSTAAISFDQLKVKSESVDLESLFNSPVSSPKIVPKLEPPSPPPAVESSMVFDDLAVPPFGPTKPQISPLLDPLKSIKEKEKNVEMDECVANIKSMFSTDEDDDDDDNKLKIVINEAVLASDDQHDEPELEEHKEDDTEQKRRAEEEAEQDIAIKSIVDDRKTPTIIVSEEEVNPKDEIPKDETAISQEETEDAVAALLETLEGSDTINEDEGTNLEKSASPPTIRIIEEMQPVGDMENDIEQPAVGIPVPEEEKAEPWYDAKSPKELQIDEGAAIVPENEPEIPEETEEVPRADVTRVNPEVVPVDRPPKTPEICAEDDKKPATVVSEEPEKEKLSIRAASRNDSRQGSVEVVIEEPSAPNSSTDVYEFHDSDEEKSVEPQPLAHTKPTIPLPIIKSPPTIHSVVEPVEPVSKIATPCQVAPVIPKSEVVTPTVISTPSVSSPMHLQAVAKITLPPPAAVSSEPVPVVAKPVPLGIPNSSSTGIVPVVGRRTPPVLHTTRTTVDDTIDEVIRKVQADTLLTNEPPLIVNTPVLPKLPAPSLRARSRSKSKDTPEDTNIMTSSSFVITPTPNTIPVSTISKVLLTKPAESSPRRSNNSTPAPLPIPIANTVLQTPTPVVEAAQATTTAVKTEKDPDTVMEMIDPKTGILIPMLRTSDEYVPVMTTKQEHPPHQLHHLQISLQNRAAEGISKAMERPSVLEKLPLSVQPPLLQQTIALPKTEGLPAMLAQQQHLQQQQQQQLQQQQLQQQQLQQQQLMMHQQQQQKQQAHFQHPVLQQHFQQSQHISPVQQSQHMSPVQQSQHMSPVQQSQHVPPVQQSQHMPPVQQSQHMPPVQQQHQPQKGVVMAHVGQSKTNVIHSVPGPFSSAKSPFSPASSVQSPQLTVPSTSPGNVSSQSPYGVKTSVSQVPSTLSKQIFTTSQAQQMPANSQSLAYHQVALVRPPEQPLMPNQAQHRPTLPQNTIRPLHSIQQAQLVRIPQVPSATTITKVNAGDEQQRKSAMIQQHPSVILTASPAAPPSSVGMGGSIVRTVAPPAHPHQHQQQPVQIQHAEILRMNKMMGKEDMSPQINRSQDAFNPTPRIEVGGSVVGAAAPSPKAGRVPQQHEQTPPPSTQQRVIAQHHSLYDPALGDVRVLPHVRQQQESSHYISSQSAHAHVYPPHYIPASIAGSMGANIPQNQQSPYVMMPAPTDKMVQQQDKRGTPELHKGGATLTLINPERVGTQASLHIPPHLTSPLQSDQRGSESPLAATVYNQRHLYTAPVPAHQPPPSHHRQTFSNPYADLDEGRFSNSPYHQYDPHRVVEREREVRERVPSPYGTSGMVARHVSPPPAHSRYGMHPVPAAEAPSSNDRQRPSQVPTPPHGSQVPPQGDSLLMLLQRYPIMWQGLLALKNDNAACQMHFVSGNMNVARDSLPSQPDGTIPPLRISQRMRLEQTQLEGVARKMQMEPEHCMLLALPCGRDHMDVLQQSNNLRNGFITYLQLKQAAGIVNICHPINQQPAYVIHIFPSCDFANENLARIAPDLLHGVADIAHLLIVIATV